MSQRFSIIVALVALLLPFAAKAQPFNIYIYADGEESSESGSIREYLVAQGHTVRYDNDGPTFDVSTAEFDDFDVIIAEHTCGGGTLIGLEDWFESGRGYVALLNGSMYNDGNDGYIMGLLEVNSNGCPVADDRGSSAWSIANLEWVDADHPIANNPNDGFTPDQIQQSQNRYHVALPDGEDIIRDRSSGAIVVTAQPNILGPGSGNVVFMGTNFHGDTRTDPEVRMLVENMLTWAVIGGDMDDDGFTAAEGDCDDEDPDINPDAEEICDEIDNDCDEDIDEGFDVDEDDFTTCGGDCDDTDGDIYPGAHEICNAIDDDCDEAIDEGFDIDDDGFTTCGGDCNDGNADINPDADEVCNSRDDDCDGETDEGMMTTYYGDFDRDGFGNLARPREACEPPAQHVANSDDCDDTSAAVNPDAVEVCNDVDDNCNGEIDEGLLTTFYLDDDRDSFGDPLTSTDACSRPPLHVENSTDCDDTDRTINPDAAELCDGIDNDCDGEIDDGAPSETFYADADGDGHGDPDSTVSACVAPEGYLSSSDDCDDTNADAYPGATEVCDGADNNCNALTDEGVSTSYFADADGDGFGDSEDTMDACEMPAGYVANDEDCDDTDATIAPGAAEGCDGLDNDCNGVIDDGAPRETFYFDGDGDSYGDPNVSSEACVAPPGYVDNGDDCDDSDPAIHPGASETCDGVDQDCNGTADDGVATQTYYADTDDDGFGDPSTTMEACAAPDGYTDDDTDCDDDSDVTYPDATEIADSLDNDCDGIVDEDLTPDGGTPDEEGCGCTAVGSSQRSFLRSGLIRLILGWLGLIG